MINFRPLFYSLIITALLFGQSIAQGFDLGMSRNAIGHRL
jgi:cytochrome bd-type quinol oxidase subunit 2